MKYLEYLSAAKRHRQACKILNEKISTFPEDETNKDNFNYLVISLYYLSGYIIECSLKFKILELSGFDSESDVNKVECRKVGINYYEEIRIHDFEKLQDVLSSKATDITYESDATEVECLLIAWDPIVRYEEMNVDYQEVYSLYEHAVSFLKKM